MTSALRLRALPPARFASSAELELDDLDRGRRIVGLDDLEQAIRRALVRRIELERGAQVLDRGRGLAEHDHRLAGLRPRVRRADRIALVLGPGRAQLGEQLAAAGIAQLLAQLREAPGLRLLAEHHDPRLERVDRHRWSGVVGHPLLAGDGITSDDRELARASGVAHLRPGDLRQGLRSTSISAMTITVQAQDLLLERAFRWERERGDRIYFTQPMGGDQVRDYTWAQAVDEARRMATHLQSFGFPPGSRIAILSKNCAHFIMTDLAIWMAGHVSVALYPTLAAETVRYILEHSEAKLIFVGKLDDWDSMKAGRARRPAADRLRCRRRAAPERLPDVGGPRREDRRRSRASRVRPADDTALLIYTSGSTGKPKGVEHTFAQRRGARPRAFNAGSSAGATTIACCRTCRSPTCSSARVDRGDVAVRRASTSSSPSRSTPSSPTCKRARPTVFHSVPRLWLKFQQGVLRKMPQKKLSTSPARSRSSAGIVKKKVLTGLGLDATRLAVTRLGADPARAHPVVPRPRPRAARGLRHERELRLLARVEAGQ